MEWTIPKIKDYLRKDNRRFKLVSTVYKNNKTNLQWKCNDCGDTFFANFGNIRKGGGCPRRSQLFTEKEIDLFLELTSNRLTLLSKNKLSNKKLKWQCKTCKHIWEKKLFMMKGHGIDDPAVCIQCFPEKKQSRWSISLIKQVLEQKQPKIKLLSVKYVRIGDPLTWQCTICQYVWNTTWHIAKKGKGCPNCLKCRKLTTKDILDKIKGTSLTIIPKSNYENGNKKMQWVCRICSLSRGASWNQVDRSRRRGSTGCYTCEGKTHWDNKKIQAFLDQEFGTIKITSPYSNNRRAISLICLVCEHKWNTKLNTSLKGSGCPECNNPGRTETAIRFFLSNVFKVDFIRTRPNWLKNKITNSNLEIDCYCESMNLAIEVDGPHHWKFNPKFYKNQKDFEYRKQCDRIKRQIIKNKGIVFIAIRLDENNRSLKKIKKQIKLKLERKGIEIPHNWDQTNIVIK